MAPVAQRIAAAIDDIGDGLENILAKVAGEPVGFLLVVCPFGTRDVNYLTNADQTDMQGLLLELVAKWNEGASGAVH